MKEHFNNEVAELGSNLFGDFANPEDLQRFCESLGEEDQAKLVRICNETFENFELDIRKWPHLKTLLASAKIDPVNYKCVDDDWAGHDNYGDDLTQAYSFRDLWQ